MEEEEPLEELRRPDRVKGLGSWVPFAGVNLPLSGLGDSSKARETIQ